MKPKKQLGLFCLIEINFYRARSETTEATPGTSSSWRKSLKVNPPPPPDHKTILQIRYGNKPKRSPRCRETLETCNLFWSSGARNGRVEVKAFKLKNLIPNFIIQSRAQVILQLKVERGDALSERTSHPAKTAKLEMSDLPPWSQQLLGTRQNSHQFSTCERAKHLPWFEACYH